MSSVRIAGRIYQNGKLGRGVLHVDDETGKITKIAKSGQADIDVGELAILPGGIDIHVHFREPGMTQKEDWTTGTTSAAFGGITSVVDMPNTNPPTTTMKRLRQKLQIAGEKAVVDYAAWCGATWYLDDLPDMLRYSPGVKVYLGATTGDLLLEDKDRVKQVLQIAGQAGRPVVLHCESIEVLRNQRGNEANLEDHDRMRPPQAETESILDVMRALPGVKPAPPIHIAHMASADAVHAANSAGFSGGVCPHHLLLDTATCCEYSPTHGKMNPPLRSQESRDGLWQAFVGGKAAILESDHAPHTAPEKADDFHQAPAGVPGVETLLPVMLAKAMAGEVELQTVVDAATLAPARLLGLGDRGELKPGKQADFAIFDLDEVTVIDEKKLHSKCGWSPFHGMNAIFPQQVWQRGRPIVDDGKLIAKPGDGRPIFPLDEEAG